MLAGYPPYNQEHADDCLHFLQAMRDLQTYVLNTYQLGPEKVRLIFNFDN